MIQINELRITPDNKCLIIDTSIEELEYFKNVTIAGIYLDTLDTWVPNGPSSKAIEVFTEAEGNYKKHVRLELGKPIINASENTMYFVYIIANTENAPEVAQAPCDCSQERRTCTVINNKILYDSLLAGIKQVENNCDDSKGLIDLFLRMQAVLTSIKTGNYPLAIKYWKKFFNTNIVIPTIKSCGCHGRF